MDNSCIFATFDAGVSHSSPPIELKTSRKCTFGVILLLLFSLFWRVQGATYPYWDNTEPGGISGLPPNGPVVATTNAVFTVSNSGKIARWTKCGGWEELPGLSMGEVYWGTWHNPGFMTVHDHYLYVVGPLLLNGNPVQIARFDLNTGTWTALGQNFAAKTGTNFVFFPTTVAVDSLNRIYVGFWIGSTNQNSEDLSLAGQTVDMLDVSTNGGATWQQVGNGLVGVNDPRDPNNHTPDLVSPAITALHADGTNLYVGGDFSGPPGQSSHRVVMWTGDSWRCLDGIYTYDTYADIDADPYTKYGSPDGLTAVMAIESIETNIYVAGDFRRPGHSIARFSNVTGEALPIGDPPSYLNWPMKGPGHNGCEVTGVALAVNAGNLYLGGVNPWYIGTNIVYLGCLTNPMAPDATGWTSVGNVAVGNDNNTWVYCIAAATNSVYVSGKDGWGNFPDGFSRQVFGPDPASPSATIVALNTSITNTTHNGPTTLLISGTKGSHWHIFGNDGNNWGELPDYSVTLWNGSATVNVTPMPAYKLVDNCSESPAVSSGQLIDIQFGSSGDPYIETGWGPLSYGFGENDYWNMGTPVLPFSQISFTAKDYLGIPTFQPVLSTQFLNAGFYNPPVSVEPLYNGYVGSSGTFQISVALIPGIYDVYVFSDPNYPTTFNVAVAGQSGTTDSTSPAAAFQNVTVTDRRSLLITCSSPTGPKCNGIQIIRQNNF